MSHPIYIPTYTSTDIAYAALHYYTDKKKCEQVCRDAMLTLHNRMVLMGKELQGEVIPLEIHRGKE